MRYEDTHRTFLQMIMHAGIMSDYDVQQAVVQIFNYSNSALFHISFINTKLDPLGMMIKSACSEFTGEKYWMLVTNIVDDNTTRFQTEFSQAQLELLRKVFTEIIGSDDGNVSSSACLNYCSALENTITKASAEEFLNDTVRRKWLDSKDGKYYMGVRSIMELMPYFRATYQEGFNNCPLCQQAVFHGRRCGQCQVVAHLYCLANVARIQKPLLCPNCGVTISTDGLPEPQERAMDLDDTAAGPSVSQKRMKRSTKGRPSHR